MKIGKDIMLRFIGMLSKSVSSRKKCKTFHQGISHTHCLLQGYIASARGTSQKGTLFPASEAYNWVTGAFPKAAMGSSNAFITIFGSTKTEAKEIIPLTNFCS